ncbi:MAG TPA: gluconeogenesis factor YvcK family protein [Herpetosiphonaceae bacterium]|nr:gluconeogenesis factor YvcK family protein [Herpetosiphonaceae bacterium]
MNGHRPFNLKWLYPGMHVKRWLLLLFVGITLGALGLALLLRNLYATGYRFPPSVYYLTLQFWPRPVRGIVVGSIGLVAIAVAILRLQNSLLTVLMPQRNRDSLANLVFERRIARTGPRIVAIGGGHGLSTLLSGLKNHTAAITAIVNVADDGGSSGRLRREYGVLPPGDIRRCLAALAEADEGLMKQLFEYRFPAGKGLEGHSFGNLFITALDDLTGSFDQAIQAASEVLAVRGRVLPSTLMEVNLSAELRVPVGAEARTIQGESQIAHGGLPIKRVFLSPADAPAYPPVVRAILEADAVIVGPGSLFTSLLPVLLIPEVLLALRATRALRIYVCNVATEPGETDHFGVADHINALLEHIGDNCIDLALVNDNDVPAGNFAPEWQGRTEIVPVDVTGTPPLRLVTSDIINPENPLRHDSRKLAAELMRLLRDRELYGR